MKNSFALNEIKPKSVIIEGNLHQRFKVLCQGKNLKIGGVIEELMKLYLDNPKKIQALIEENNEIDYTYLHK